MKNNIFIPKTIKVGYQKRNDTYTKKLAYIIYTDEKGKLRKEASWKSWRDKKIDPSDFDNEPTSGFVLNKKAGGYSSGWNHRQTYSRVYDPRGFEFEITIPNLLYILENTNCIKGKGLEGEFVYGWSGTDLILIPVDSPDYKEIKSLNTLIHSKEHIKGKDLILGATYRTRQNEEWIYMGRFEKYSYEGNEQGKYYCFLPKKFLKNLNGWRPFSWLKSVGTKFVKCISEDPVSNYAELMEVLEKNTYYSPVDKNKVKYVPLTFEQLQDLIEKDYFSSTVFIRERGNIYKIDIRKVQINGLLYRVTFYENSYDGYCYRPLSRTDHSQTLEEVFNRYKPMYREEYLQNGKLYRTTPNLIETEELEYSEEN